MVARSRGVPSAVEARDAAERAPTRPGARARVSHDAEQTEGTPSDPGTATARAARRCSKMLVANCSGSGAPTSPI